MLFPGHTQFLLDYKADKEREVTKEVVEFMSAGGADAMAPFEGRAR